MVWQRCTKGSLDLFVCLFIFCFRVSLLQHYNCVSNTCINIREKMNEIRPFQTWKQSSWNQTPFFIQKMHEIARLLHNQRGTWWSIRDATMCTLYWYEHYNLYYHSIHCKKPTTVWQWARLVPKTPFVTGFVYAVEPIFTMVDVPDSIFFCRLSDNTIYVLWKTYYV